ncbi:ABC transporter ATP-binding protein/permease [Brachybacterium saurashtrense]|uniref:ABC transporter ATP-binding protein n=1 Tax=Brachybacterium saurashtrense TaxID=556288 RepID=A0A345YQD1_9MICO|nr:ABC transporter ATP-binding protein [Brachybacterium saurashtrense]AXK46133.1 ABC transporter ATP-binding protein [Brachybacterium saurashtrense]RRR23873.1 ABC transporter ATP-binding protein [Brachybacterium saurashtrense]
MRLSPPSRLQALLPALLDPRIAPHARAAGGGLAAVAGVTLGAGAASAGAALALASATTRILVQDPRGPWAVLAAAVGLLALRAALLWLRDLLALRTGSRVTRRLRERLLDHVIALGPGHHWQGGAARAHLAVVDGCEHLRGYIGSYLPQAIAAVAVPAVLLSVIALQDGLVALVILVMLLGIPVGQRLTRRLLGRRAAAHWEQYEEYGARVADSIAGLATLAGLGTSDRRARTLALEADRLREETTRTMNVSLSTSVVTGAAMLLGTAGATVLAAWHATRGELAPGAVVLVLFLAAECFRPLQELQNYWHEGFYGLAAAGRINQVLEIRPPVQDSLDARSLRRTGPPALHLREVSFRYPGAEREALRAVSATIPAGRTTALVGASGAGKTTLTALLLRDVDPTAGTVQLEDEGGAHDLRTLPLAQLRQRSSRVSQDVVLLDGTLRENLDQALPSNGGAEDIERALAAARVDEFLDQLPHGADSPVGEGGGLLSGGQRQRVALARALLQDTPLLVLDEATSALDGENEQLITEALRTHRDARTVVVIAHRLSTVAEADHVIVLEDGEVAEEGPPAALERAGGPWARMLEAQRGALSPAPSPTLAGGAR